LERPRHLGGNLADQRDVRELGCLVERIVVVGCSGAGKTTVARSLAGRLGLEHLELDDLYNLEDWAERPQEETRELVAAVTAAPQWVVDGNYPWMTDLTWGRADTIVFLDLPRRTVMRQIVWRTVQRVLLRTTLWNGNRERWSSLLSRDPTRSMIWWAWARHPVYRERYRKAIRDPRWSHLRVVHLQSRRAVRRFLAGVCRPSC
jgi:adenylate kinase family enzyme